MEAFPAAPLELPLQVPDEEVVGAPADNTTQARTMSYSGSGRAFFSTELGTRPPRKLIGPPFPPVIVRSDKVAGVVQTALHWRKKHPQVCWTVFPQCGWTVEDFWDAEDIHIDTRTHLAEVLTFLSRDNSWCASKFAQDWSRAHPEQVNKVLGVGDLKDFYDPKDHLAIVDKLFVNGETADKPREFLWHVAHIMRTALVKVRENQQCAASARDSQDSISVEQPPSAPEQSSTIELSLDKLQAANASSAQRSDPHADVPQPCSSNTVPPTSAPFVPPSASSQHGPLQVVKLVPAHGPPPPGAYHGQPMGHIMGGMPGQMWAQPIMGVPDLRNSTGRTGPGGPHNQPMPPVAYGENLPRGPSGAYSSRPPSGAMSNIHSPHFNAAPMMGQPVMGPQHPMPPYSQSHPQISPASYPAQLYHPDYAHLSMMYPPAHMVDVPMATGYVNQPFHDQSPRGMPIGDTTNSQYYSSVPSNDPISRRPPRRGGIHSGGNNVLYDPYGGCKPPFHDSHSVRKTSRGGYSMDQPGRSRNPSFADNRSRTASYANEWVEQAPSNGNRYLPRSNIDDRSIVDDLVRGCDRTWIGPENQTVSELFVSDLPKDVHADEVKSLFSREINITPVMVTIKCTANAYHPHAFVLFSTSSDAKQGLRVNDADPKIRGALIRITVPRRFYQKNDEYRHSRHLHQLSSRQVEERANRSVTRMPSTEEEAGAPQKDAQSAHMYSSQDARSDLQKRSSPEALSLDHPVEGNSVELNTETLSPTVQHEDTVEEKHEVKDTAESTLILGPTLANKDDPVDTTIEIDASSTDEQAVKSVFNSTHIVESEDTPAQLTDDSLLDGALATAEDSVLQPSPLGKSLTTEYDGFEPQTKVVLESTDTLAATVRLPDLDKTVEAMFMDATREETTEIEPSSVPKGETEAEGEQEPDSSFLSAQEVIATTEPILVPAAEPRVTDQETVAVKTSASTEASAAPPLHIAPETPEELILSDPVPADQDTAALVPAQASNTEETELKVAPSNDIELTTTPPQPLVTAAKKMGPQQTASINPFGITKAHRHKEREQKKKEKRRELEEKAAKAKTEKADRVGTVSYKATSLTKNNNQDRVASMIPSSSSLVDPPAMAATTDAVDSPNTPPTSDEGKGKIKPKVSFTDSFGQALPVRGQETSSGKQNGGTTTEVPNAGTHKAKVASKGMKAPTEEESSVATALLALAQSPDYDGPLTPNSSTEFDLHHQVSTESSVNTNDGSAKVELHLESSVKDSVTADAAPTVPVTPKVKKAVPPVPKLNLHLDSARRTVPQPDTEATRPSSSSSGASVTATQLGKSVSGTDADQQLTVQKVMSPLQDSDALSVASSATLHHNESTLLSPSSIAQDYSTPLQTPVMPPASREEPPKPKKKKNKKKKKKKTAAVLGGTVPIPATDSVSAASASIGASSAAGPSVPKTATFVDGNGNWNGDPFGGQMSHIDAIRQLVTDPRSPFNETATYQRPARDPAKENDDYRQIQAWMMENPKDWEHLRAPK